MHFLFQIGLILYAITIRIMKVYIAMGPGP